MKLFRLRDIDKIQTRFQYKIINNNLFCDNKILLWAWVYYDFTQKQIKQHQLQIRKNINQFYRVDISKHQNSIFYVRSFFNKIRLKQIQSIYQKQYAAFFWKYIDSDELKFIFAVDKNQKGYRFFAVYNDFSDTLYQMIKNFTIAKIKINNFFQQKCQIIQNIIKKPEQVYTQIKKKNNQSKQADGTDSAIFYLYGNSQQVGEYIKQFQLQFQKINFYQLDDQASQFSSIIYNYIQKSQLCPGKTMIINRQNQSYILYHESYFEVKQHSLKDQYDFIKYDKDLQKAMSQNQQLDEMIKYSKDLLYFSQKMIIGKKSQIKEIKKAIQKKPQRKQLIIKQKKVPKVISSIRVNITKENFLYFLSKFDSYKMKQCNPYFFRMTGFQITNYLEFKNKIFFIFEKPQQIISLQTIIKGFEMSLDSYISIIKNIYQNQDQFVYKYNFKYGKDFIFLWKKTQNKKKKNQSNIQNLQNWEQIITYINSQDSMFTKSIVIGYQTFMSFLPKMKQIKNFCTIGIQNGVFAKTKMSYAQFTKQSKETKLNAIKNISQKSEKMQGVLGLVKQLLNKNVKRYTLKKSQFQKKDKISSYIIDPITSYNLQIKKMCSYQLITVPIPYQRKQVKKRTQYVYLSEFAKLFLVKRANNNKVQQLQEIKKDYKTELQKRQYKILQRMSKQALFFGFQFFLIYGKETLQYLEEIYQIQKLIYIEPQVDFYNLKYWQRSLMRMMNKYQIKTKPIQESKANQQKIRFQQIIEQQYWSRTSSIYITNKQLITELISINLGYGQLQKSKDEKTGNLLFKAQYKAADKIIKTLLEKHQELIKLKAKKLYIQN